MHAFRMEIIFPAFSAVIFLPIFLFTSVGVSGKLFTGTTARFATDKRPLYKMKTIQFF